MTSNSTLAPPPVRRLFGGVMYKGPFIYGIVLALDLLALSHALSAIVKTRARRLPLPWYFVIVAAIIVAHVLDATLAAVSWTPEAVGPGFMLIAPGFLSANVVGVVFGWLNNAGFTALNFIRLRAFTKPDYPWLTWLMTCLVAVSCLACTANNIMYIICYIRNSTLAPELAVADTVYGYWSIFDCAVNTSSSIGFAAVMQIMFPIGEAVRPGLKALLRRAQAILAVECVVFIAVNGTVLAAPYLDPILLVPYTVEALRLNLFTQFLCVLGRLLKRSPGTISTSATCDNTLEPNRALKAPMPPGLASNQSMTKSISLRPQYTGSFTSNMHLAPGPAS